MVPLTGAAAVSIPGVGKRPATTNTAHLRAEHQELRTSAKDVRLCIGKIAVSSASDPRATRSGGREPAVVRDNRAGRRMRLPTMNARR